MSSQLGKVYLVGAGPGDPGLITQKALDLIRKADVIFYDNLVNPLLLKEAGDSCEKIYVGKRGEGNSTEQQHIEDQLVKAAQKAKCVVRLKGGDPFIFGRGGEEAQRLVQEKIAFEIVPGVTSAIAVPAYAGIPLTHRNFTSSVAFVTGHFSVQESFAPLNWDALSKIGTLVFLMGVKSIRKNMESLIAAGKDPQTPAAIIRWGTYPKQQTLVSTISQIADKVEEHHLMPPAILITGEVVNLRNEITWFESKPLFAKTILVTRARQQASELSQKLRDLGAHVIEVPALEIHPPASWKKMDLAIKNIKKYDWLVFTSINAVQSFFGRLQKLKKDIRDLSGLKIAAVGPSTAEALEKLHLQVAKLPAQFNARKLALSFKSKDIKGKRFLFPRAKEGRDDLIDILTEKGAKVDLLIAYENKIPKNMDQTLQNISEIDCITFASSSSVENFVKILSPSQYEKFKQSACVCIGPQSLQKAKELGFEKAQKAPQSTINALIQKITELFS